VTVSRVKEESGMMTRGRKVGKGKMLAALALILISLSTIGYAAYTFGSFTVTTKDIATVSVGTMDLGTIPKNSAGTQTFSKGVNATYGDAAFAGRAVTVKCELVISNPDVSTSFRSFVVDLYDGATLEATVTTNSPYAEFAYTIVGGTETVSYDIKVTYYTGSRAVTVAAGDCQLAVDVIG
jgi:hypothetical protein